MIGLNHIKEPNYYFEDDLFAIKSDLDEYIFTASHEFEVEIQNRGLRYIKEYKVFQKFQAVYSS